jgi:FtsP/CotA-like multicopper oxidase with cupredoxin domain
VIVAACATAGVLAGTKLRDHAPAAPATRAPQAPIWIAGVPTRHIPRLVAHAAGRRAAPAAAATARAKAKAKPKTRAAAARVVAAGKVTRRAAAIVAFDLCATTGSVTFGSTSITIWGFAFKGVAADCSDITASLPGPQLTVNKGDSVTINVTNALPGTRDIAIEAAGIPFVPGPNTAGHLQTVSMSFTATNEGTYLYDSNGDAGRQEAMGLYGALVVNNAATPGQAYGQAYDVQKVLVLSELDAGLNADPDHFNLVNWDPTYWLVNGQQSPGPINATAGQRVLLRYVNAGADHNTMTLLNAHERFVGRDAFALTDPFDAVSETLPAGETGDAILTVPAGSASGTRFPIYNRQLRPGMDTAIVVP